MKLKQMTAGPFIWMRCPKGIWYAPPIPPIQPFALPSGWQYPQKPKQPARKRPCLL